MSFLFEPNDEVYMQVEGTDQMAVHVLISDGQETVAFPLDADDIGILITLLQRELIDLKARRNA